MYCYFDNSATTKPLISSVAAAVSVMEKDFGNPSSLHEKGFDAALVLEKSKKTLAGALGCRPDEVIFTSGGTESNNIAIMGAANAGKRQKRRIVTTCVEHPSVLECMKRLEEDGFEIIRLPVDKNCMISLSDLRDAVNENTSLISIMLVNNEVGSVMPVQKIRAITREAGSSAVIHCDAVQAFGKIPVNVKSLDADLLTVSSHKVHGPKGVGALYVKKGTRLTPYILGGGQEYGLRSGTQNMPGIAGFSAAVFELSDTEKNAVYVSELKQKLLSDISLIDGLTVNSPDGFPYILNISLCGIPSQVLLNFLSEEGVYVSSGSACSKGHRSYVLTSMGLPAGVIDSAVRISFSRFNTVEETAYLAECLKKANKTIRKR